ncbi:hypothetical protein HNP48_001936 [Acidovorax soli]|uniref:TnsA endonuclease N terminal n=1 Tax=Acidovorax soli TaxID=592050 RepID=A0A7X0PCG6_9BURK|nr:TnsA endonuclease N-terminal domain-containing protein [Acidovorax soli]MBB6559269.1 hypothetical protein [Acidovorax soli]
MRTEKRFTPALLNRYLREGRGTGTHADYIPWHRVSRSDPASCGRSHLILWRERQRELLSDGEWTGLNFAVMLGNVVDLAEQFPLSHVFAPTELSRWDIRAGTELFPGTVALAKHLGIKHPTAKEKEDVTLWTGTTDLLLVLTNGSRPLTLLAISCKPDTIDNLSKRAHELLSLEKSYWDARGVRWLLITPELYEKSVGLTLRRTACWGLAEVAPEAHTALACRTARLMSASSESDVIQAIAETLMGEDQQYLAQCALWQSIWQGKLPVDLRRGWRPHQPLRLIPEEAFLSLNPIGSGRSAWK